jgi:hypothetical protein
VWDLDEFDLQILQVLVIELKPALKRAIRRLPLALEELEDLGQDFIHVDRRPSLC